MKKMEVKGLSVEDLEAKANQLKGELKKLEFNHSISPIENPNVIKETRRNNTSNSEKRNVSFSKEE